MFLNGQIDLSSIYSLHRTLIIIITTYLCKLQYLMSMLSKPVLKKLSQSVQETKKVTLYSYIIFNSTKLQTIIICLLVENTDSYNIQNKK